MPDGSRRFRAPGRVNLIGGQVDYHEGWVVSMAIDRDVCVTAQRTPDRARVVARSGDLEGIVDGRRGVGTFVASELVPYAAGDVKELRSSLQSWVERARAAGLDEESMTALLADMVRPASVSRVA